MRMTLADKFVYYQKLFMRRGENVNQTLVGLMGSHYVSTAFSFRTISLRKRGELIQAFK